MKASLNLLVLGLCLFLWTGCRTSKTAQSSEKSMNATAYPYAAKRLPLASDLALAYRDTGSGEQTLLMIHGLGSYLPVWDKMTALLKGKFRCVQLDLPGYGHSDPAPMPVSIAYFAEQVESFARKLKLKNIILVGHSMGGQIAMRVCLNKKLTVRQLVLLAPAGIERFSPEEAATLKSWVTPASVLAQTESQTAHNFAVNFYGNQLPEDARFMFEDREALKKDSAAYAYFSQLFPASMMAMLEGPVYAELPQLTLPTLVLYGADDQLIPNRFLHPNMTIEQVAEAARTELPRAKVALLPQCGHFVPWDQAEAVSRHLLEFTTSTYSDTP